jgi:hypothetical protein
LTSEIAKQPEVAMKKRAFSSIENILNDSVDDFVTSRKKPKPNRFQVPTDEEDIKEISKGFVPENTKKNTMWACRAYEEWRLQRNKVTGDEAEKCPDDLISNPSIDSLNRWIPRFIVEARKVDGTPYPPRTLNQLLAGIQRKMKELHPELPAMLNKDDRRFHPIHGTCDTVFRQLHQKSVGADVRHTNIFTAEDEEKLWSSGVLSVNHPVNLQRAVFFT